jgi:hypothetical protein
MTYLTGLVETIDSNIEHTQAKEEYASLQAEIKRLEQAFISRQNCKMEELTHQNKVLQDLLEKISQKIETDHFLSISVDDMKCQQATPQFKVRIEPEKGQGGDYYRWEKIRFRVRASRDCSIKVIYLPSTAEGPSNERRMNILLFPNTHDTDNRISAGETKAIGRRGELEIRLHTGKT